MTIDSTLPRAGSPDDNQNAGPFARPACPLLTPEDWERLQEIVPELVHAAVAVSGLGDGVGTDPSLDAADVLLVVKGIEYSSRVTASTEAVVLARAEC